MSEQESVFSIAVGEFSDELFGKIAINTGHYTIPLIRNDFLEGSGTLVSIDGVLGILTAAHVLIDHGWDNSSTSGQEFRTSADRWPDASGEKMENLSWWIVSSGPFGEGGPDIAFIRLPLGGAVTSILKGKKLFWNLTVDPDAMKIIAPSPDRYAAFCGFVDEETHPKESSSSFDQVIGFQGYAFIGGATSSASVQGYDLYGVACQRSTPGSIPRSFDCVSGGGLWSFGLTRKKDDPVGKENLKTLTLSGLAYYQLKPDSEKPIIRCHGPRSIYELALPEIRAWLKPSTEIIVS